ncbi:McrC family protein [Actinophytocola algeriensis]|uniref:5-methylcytosine-specific restriction enzyme subunit McrC n=1 Tax=Actinophytocola algeriensis TaxID=1768010 RepID=A0A7W7Q4P1_9PSEU|nr:restriction endonuclease [Actinophytocola algeriensis]MBB4907000.1 5-methylcytosine-specific restriction enzyme subunit McrC [Actinophytocola algeriensis]MBE1478483.1 5-methylcytosine-specific restriction enzyme subunit McrC [Actinophytocola algeriensis]
MPVVELDELGSSAHSLTTEQGQRLARSGLVSAAPSALVPGQWDVAARGKVGVARVGDVDLWIRPKLDIARLLFLVGYAVDPKGWRDDEVELATGDGLVPAVANALWRQTERALRQGLLQGYREVEETSYVLRGRLREADQLRRHHGRVIPMELRHDDFTVDVAENQILLAAVTRMLTVPRVDDQSRQRLTALRVRLADVTSLIRGARLPAWRPNRLNARYHSALRLAEIVWQATSPEHAPGTVTATGFLFDLARVFEDFVTVGLAEALPTHAAGTAHRQYPCSLDEAAAVGMKPDLVWRVGGSPAAVVDAKYKQEKPEGYPNADLYQLLAYCTALGLRRGHLVYAKGNGLPARHVVRHAGVEIVCHALDLTLRPAELLGLIDRLARDLAGNK